MRIVVTGAAGRIGRKICVDLVSAGHQIVALDRRYDPSLSEIPGLEQRVTDLLDAVSLYPPFGGADALVHFGNYPNVQAAPADQVYRENILMNHHAFGAAVAVGIRKIVFASSVQVIEGQRRLGDDPMMPSEVPELPMTGATPANPSNLYGLSKLAGEDLLRMLCRRYPELAGVAVRLPWTSPGPLMQHPIDLDSQRAKRWRLNTRLDDGFSWLDIAEVGPLVGAILTHGRPGYDCVFPASDDSQLQWPAERIAERFFPDVPVRGDLAGRFTLVDTSPITEMYGWRPADLSRHRDREHRPATA
ncbi:MAG: NAD(P)-dependent oxidoreductase [Planctomycetota bacterium]